MVQPRLRALVRSSAVVALVAAVALTPLSAQAADPVPLAARLLAEPYQNGTAVTVSNLSHMYGLATDGALAYMLDDSGNVLSTPLADIDLTAGSTVTVTATVHPVGWGIGAAPSLPTLLPQLSISYSHGCLFITDDSSTLGAIRLYCIDVSDWSVTELAVPSSSPLPVGTYYMFNSLLDFPDGRIGKISAYEPVADGWESVLRTYMVSGTGKNVALAFSEDFTFFDTDFWAYDEHGIATDGTYLYRIQYNGLQPDFKSWKLTSGARANVVFSGAYTEPFINMHFLAHNHAANYYLVGDHAGTTFYITESADATPDGPVAVDPSALAATGADAAPLASAAALLLAAGLVLAVLRRRGARSG